MERLTKLKGKLESVSHLQHNCEVKRSDFMKLPVKLPVKVFRDNGTTILSCPNPSCNYEQYGNVWDMDKCPECGQETEKY